MSRSPGTRAMKARTAAAGMNVPVGLLGLVMKLI
jgi:hypothetical protein